MNSATMFPTIALLLLMSTAKIAVGQYPNVSFVPGTSLFGLNNNGIVQVSLSATTMGTICNDVILNVNYPVLCYLLGFEAVGTALVYPTPLPASVTSLKVVMSRLNCSSSDITLSVPSTIQFNKCKSIANTAEFSATCTSHGNDLAVICPTARITTSTAPTTTTTPAPVTIVPPNCNASGSTGQFRFANGSSTNSKTGRLEFLYQNVWGTVCVEGMNEVSAKLICKQLCIEPLQPRVVGSQTYGQGDSSQKITLSGISCPDNATNFIDCSYTTSLSGCNNLHSLDAGLECDTVSVTAAPVMAPSVDCTNQVAYAYFDRSTTYAFVNESLITLYPLPVPSGCLFNVTGNLTHVIAIIPLSGCNPTLITNTTYTRIEHKLYRNVYPIGGVLTRSPYVVPVVCYIFRNNSNSGGTLNAPMITLPPVDDTADNSFTLTLYTDASYKTPLTIPASVSVQDPLYLKVTLEALKAFRLILQSCWATTSSSANVGPYYFIMQNKCAVASNTKIIFINDGEVHLEFTMFEIPNAAQIYLHCSGYTCNTQDSVAINSQQCYRSCNTNILSRRRRSEALVQNEMELSAEGSVQFLGPLVISAKSHSSSNVDASSSNMGASSHSWNGEIVKVSFGVTIVSSCLLWLIQCLN